MLPILTNLGYRTRRPLRPGLIRVTIAVLAAIVWEGRVVMMVRGSRSSRLVFRVRVAPRVAPVTGVATAGGRANERRIANNKVVPGRRPSWRRVAFIS